jgi:hypothetical protein
MMAPAWSGCCAPVLDDAMSGLLNTAAGRRADRNPPSWSTPAGRHPIGGSPLPDPWLTFPGGRLAAGPDPGCVKTAFEGGRWIKYPIRPRFPAASGEWCRIGDPHRAISGALSLTMQNFLRFHTAWTRRRHRLSEQRRRQCNPERTLRESSCSSLTRRSRPHKAAAWEDDPSRCPTKTSSANPNLTSSLASASPGNRRRSAARDSGAALISRRLAVPHRRSSQQPGTRALVTLATSRQSAPPLRVDGTSRPRSAPVTSRSR